MKNVTAERAAHGLSTVEEIRRTFPIRTKGMCDEDVITLARQLCFFVDRMSQLYLHKLDNHIETIVAKKMANRKKYHRAKERKRLAQAKQ